ncbi:MAG: ATP-binding protein [Ilumatobacteraceae bacterium]
MSASTPALRAAGEAIESPKASEQMVRRVAAFDLDPLIDATLRRAGPDELIESAAKALAPLGVIGGALIVADKDGRATSMSTTGVSTDIERHLGPTVLDGSFPVMATLHSGEPGWFRSPSSVAARFPAFASIPSTWHAYAALPLRIDGALVGSVALPFDEPQTFGPVVRTAVQSAVALLARGAHRIAQAEPSATRRASSVFERVHDGVVIIDRTTGRFVDSNAAALSIIGLRRVDLIGHPIDEIVGVLQPRLVAPPQPINDGCHVAVSTITRADGTQRNIECYYSLDTTTSLMTLVISDVTDWVADGPAAFTETQEALFAERNRVARDLHDGVVQSVFAISLSLASLALRSPEPARSVIEQSIDGLDAIVRQVRSTVFDLRQRQTTTLSARIAHELTDAEAALGFRPVACVDDTVDSISDHRGAASGLADHLLLALRETLSNAARHARASRVWVDVRAAGDAAWFVVTDDGIGFDLTAACGDGLSNLRERAASLGGSCAIGGRPDGGTTVTWWVPLSGHLESEHDVAC